MKEIILLTVYAVLMIAVTLLFTKKSKDMESFYVGNRNMGVLRAAMSIAATWIWAPALFVSAEKAYSNGFAGLFWFLVPNVLCLILFIPFAKKIREIMPNGVTLSGFMKERYKSNSVKNVYLVQLTGLTILSTAVQLLAGGKILSAATGIPFPVMAVMLAVIAFAYSQFSGIEASVMTDAIQMVLIILACVIFVPKALFTNNGFHSMISGIGGFTGDYRSLISAKGYEVFIGFGLPTAIGLISGPFGDQCFWQRAFSIKKNKIGKAFFVGALLFAIVPLSMGILGFIAAGSGFVPKDAGIVNFELVTYLFPKWAEIPFLFMLISGLLSTIDSNLCAISSLAGDMLKKNTLKKSKVAMVAILIIGFIIANIPGLTVTKLFLFYGTLRATTLLPTVFTLKGMKLTGKAVTIGVVVSLCVGLPIFAYGTFCNIAMYKTIGSLTTVLISGIIAIALSRREVKLQ